MPQTAKEMAASLRQLVSLLFDAGIIEDQTLSHIEAATASLRARGASEAWTYRVEPTQPLLFNYFEHGQLDLLRPKVSAVVSVAEHDDDQPAFTQLNVTLEIVGVDGEPVARWHLDRANSLDLDFQKGPLFHLQAGGHWPQQDRKFDLALKEPRWCHPPLDIILMSEIVVANFYPNEWQQKLRNSASWCSLIQSAQHLCMREYSKRLNNALEVSRSTALSLMWAGEFC